MTALFERDAFAFQAAKRLAILDAEHEGLVFDDYDFDPQRRATSAASACATTTTNHW